MSYTATTTTLDHIAYLVEQARPDWEGPMVKIILRSHAGQVDGNDLAIAALRAAANLDLPVPKAIGWRGPHWDGLRTMPAAIASPTRCGVCGKPEPRCYSERPGNGDDHRFEPPS